MADQKFQTRISGSISRLVGMTQRPENPSGGCAREVVPADGHRRCFTGAMVLGQEVLLGAIPMSVAM